MKSINALLNGVDRGTTNLVIDLGDVLFSYKAAEGLPVSPFLLKRILETPQWHDYERGRLSKDECHESLEEAYGLKTGELDETLAKAASTLIWNEELTSVLRHLKTGSNGMLKIYAMSNIAAPSYEVVRPMVEDGGIFDRVFTSSVAGTRKPEIAYYKHVAQELDVDASSILFIDDKPENLIVAQTLGWHPLWFNDTESTVQKLLVLLQDPVERAEHWLSSQSKKLWTVTDSKIEIHDQFAQLVILLATGDKGLVQIAKQPLHAKWNVFLEKPVLTDQDYPDDLDTTTMAFLALDVAHDTKHAIMDEMLQYMNADNLPLTYFDHSRPRFDPFIGANMLRLFYKEGRAHQMTSVLEFCHNCLKIRGLNFGTRYYPQFEWFLYYLAETCGLHGRGAPELEGLKELLRERLQERTGASGDNTAIVLRVLAAQMLDMPNDKDLCLLVAEQCADGAWDKAYIWKYGRSGALVSNRGVVTALAVKALKASTDRLCHARSRI